MGKRTDIKKILILGAGPIVIGQACEFDYSGVQACRALLEEGYHVILVNSNPATIMTDPEMAQATYIEPVHWTTVSKIIEKERPDAILPTMGGQTALNCALDLAREGVLERFNVELIGATKEAIDKAEDREKFRQAMHKLGLDVPKSGIAHSVDEALALQASFGFPTIIRPSFTMGGSGGGIAYNMEEFIEICLRGLDLSPTHELLIEESLIGWKEYELEVVRDRNDNCIIVCSIENLDPMGIHTGDSITIAPAQTLTDKEYQLMRTAAFKILREIGVDTGGSNVQFGVNPRNGRMVVIEMNPRVSRSSALASKATGFPIAKIAAKLAVGYTLDELSNDITGGTTPAAFEPVLDYVVTKIPRFSFEKFPRVDARLTTQMKSVGEVMAIGRTFQESLQKAIRGLEIDFCGLEPMVDFNLPAEEITEILKQKLTNPEAKRLWYIADAFRAGFSVTEVYNLTAIDPWFLEQIAELISLEKQVVDLGMAGIDREVMRVLKQKGFSDRRLAQLLEISEQGLRKQRHVLGVRPVYKHVDTCAAEFRSTTAYLYSCYDTYDEAQTQGTAPKVVVLGGGPNRIGQGIEFDYCCVHAAMALREDGYQTIMINCNPETVSTDYDISDVLYFEPLTLEDVLEIIEREQPFGVIVQYGGQTPLKLARDLELAGVKIIGTSPDAIDRAEDRDRFRKILQRLNLRQPANGMARTLEEAIQVAKEVGYPLLVRPSYVLGGRAMEIVYNQDELSAYFTQTLMNSGRSIGGAILLDRFLDDAIEVDIDAISDGKEVVIGGIMEHIEQAGVHSGDSACCLPPHQLSAELQAELGRQMTAMAKELGVIGLVNAQFAVQNGDIYVLEVNPRASRTVPFVSKAIGQALAKIAVRCMLGVSLASQGCTELRNPKFFAVKIPVFPFTKFSGADPLLGPEMKSTGEVMGIGRTPVEAFAKAQMAAGIRIKKRRIALISVRDQDKPRIVELARNLQAHGFTIHATNGTARALLAAQLDCHSVHKVNEGRPHIVDLIKNGDVDLIVNTTEGKNAIADSYIIRKAALQHNVVYSTTVAGALAISLALKHENVDEVYKLQSLWSDQNE